MSEDCLRRIVGVLRKNAPDEWLNEQAVRRLMDMRDDGTRGLHEALGILTSRGYLRARHVGGEWQWMVNMDEPSWNKGRPTMTRDELLALRVRCPVCAGLVWVDGFLCRTCRGTGYVLPATDEVLGLAEEAIPMTDWQPHEQLSADSSPAEDWTEPMVDASNSSTPPEEHVGKHLLTGGLKPEDVEPDPRATLAERDLLKQRVAELEAENERLRAALMPLETSSIAYVVQEAAAATMQRDQLQAVLEQERRAVEALAEHIEIACEGFSHGSMSAITVAPGGYMDAAEIAAWARNRARAESGE